MLKMESDKKAREEDSGGITGDIGSMNISGETDVSSVDKDQRKRYYVDFYDMFDGWGEFGFFIDRLFDDLNEAIKLCDKLNSELDKGNKSCGEHYGVIDSDINREVHCGMDDAYKANITDIGEHLSRMVTQELDDLGIRVGTVNKNDIGNRVKVPGTDFDLRIDESPEEIEMVAHSAECRYCNGMVKMMRDPETFKLQPHKCCCLMCGQRYYVEIPGTIEEWELKQWKQKGQTFAMGDICPRRMKNEEK